MRRLPNAIFIVDTRKERTAILEARRLEIPVVALADTNCDPDEMDYPIPANDDAIRAVRLLCSKIADAVIEGRRELEAQQKDEEPQEESATLTISPTADAEHTEVVASEASTVESTGQEAASSSAEVEAVPAASEGAENTDTPVEPELVSKDAH